jgi:bifunctional non-homologous end joining protein LigD
MGLEEYRRKRDFRRTPEPAGEVAPKKPGEPLSFVVQKHDARNLHYDFRLELDGTLKSWAVPKGPSLHPAARRLAMHVEDHPLEYADFEGIIPDDEYGGGTVLLWDQGTWWPKEDDPVKAYRRGRLKFTLEGEKLRGIWNLVRMAPRDGQKESWLLIKDADDFSRESDEPDIIDERPESVVSGRTLEEIAAARDRVWHSNRKEDGVTRGKRGRSRKPVAAAKRSRARAPAVALASVAGAKKASLPETLSAQLATLVDDVPAGGDWLHEIKFDGYRLFCHVGNGAPRLITRNGKNWTDKFPGVAEAALTLPCEQAVLDGEAVVMDERGITSFQALQNALGRNRGAPVLYYAFDLLYLDGYDLTQAPLRTRKEVLAGLLAPLPPDGVIRYSDHVEGRGRQFYEQACAMGLEGIIAKRADRPYRAGRGTDWLKIKCVHRQEFVVVGYTDPQRSRQGFGALLLGVNDAERGLVFAGKVGTGFTNRVLRELHAKLAQHERKTPAVADPPRGAEAKGVHWLEPKFVAEVVFTEWTEDGRIRHPSFQGLREDKAAKDVVRELPRSRPRSVSGTRSHAERAGRTQRARPVARKTSSKQKSEPLRDAGIRITNADRVLYKREGVTKGDVAKYWEAVADAALPHLTDRPLTLLRCPTGPAGQCFFQKHWGQGMPETVPRVEIQEADGTAPYMYIDELPALISLVQFGVLEVHVFNCRRDRLDRPDQMIFDLDPDQTLPWGELVDAAVMLREWLAALELQSFVKTTGGKGLHVVLPLARRAGWDAVREFAHGVAEQFERADPNRFTVTMSKRTRKGKIFIDYLRNAFNATAIAPFSPRAREGAPVSVPVEWAELEGMKERPSFDVRSVPERLKNLRRDPWDGFFRVRQSISSAMRKAVGAR